MIKQRKVSKFKKTVAIYLAMMILLETLQPMQIYALTGGPSQPEFEAFTPIGTSDMVDLASGDFNYNIPIMDVGGYPLNLAYNSGVTMDQEASWVGLGWNLDVGQINRQVRGLPDDFNGDEMIYENSLKPNVTIGADFNAFITGFGVKEGNTTVKKSIGAKLSVGLGVKYNNFDGVTVTNSSGISFAVAENLSVGMNVSSSASEGVSVSPSISFSKKFNEKTALESNMGANLGVTYNSRKGLQNMTISNSFSFENLPIFVPSQSASLSFLNTSYTPTKRVGMSSSNYMFSVNVEGELWGLEGGMKFSGYRISQGVKDSEKYKVEKAYGFENTYNAGRSDILDFNREKDRTFNKNTTSLPITNNTYDIYSIQGQGIAGMYRPYKSQVGYIYDNETTDVSSGGSLGLEFGAGGGTHFGVDATVTLGNSKSTVWESSNPALGRFREKKSGNKPDYEKVFFKNIGGNHVDQELNLLYNNLGGYSPVKLNIQGDKFSRRTSVNYYTDANENPVVQGTGSIIRTKRLSRNQSIEKLTRLEASQFGFTKYENTNGKNNQFSPYSLKGKQDHHTSEIKITKEGGERYIYGRAAYNSIKKEVTFDVGNNSVNYQNGLVNYNTEDNSAGNMREGDRYFNRITTPAYAHSYLLTSVLSSDYQDLTDNGPSDDDLGTYTKFEYENKNKTNTYKWRVPFKSNQANYEEGLRSSKKDNKGNYIYGEKELLYIKKITTKTHIAIFYLSERNDGYGVGGENGGIGTDSKMYKLDKISLYSKPEYDIKKEQAIPIKEAHFEYDYSLCQGIDNNKNANDVGFKGQQGKLTLTKVYFTYKNSKMGKFTPYVFKYAPKAITHDENGTEKNYDITTDLINNPRYDMKAYDVWGSYKPSEENLDGKTLGKLSNAEYPFVDQSDREQADINASVWLLRSIKLPSGGLIEVNFEADDYAFVQDKQAMQMFKVVGSGDQFPNDTTSIDSSIKKSKIGKYLYVEIDKNFDISASNANEVFQNNYLKTVGTKDNPMYFRFLLNMVSPNPIAGGDTDKYDYVTGYIRKDGDCSFFQKDGKKYASIPMEYVGKEDGFNGNKQVNPISKAGWNFGRQYLNRLVYSMNNEEDTNDVKGVVMQLIGWMPTLLDIFTSPNGKLEQTGIASKFITGKSWIRLMNNNGHKIGGGSRVKKIELYDQWNIMTGNISDSNYQQAYGQVYSYADETGKSSGVASYEPLGCKENPLIKPFYDKNKKELLLGPDSDNYVEEPLGESFFPSPKITYSRITVANLPRKKTEGTIDMVVKKHATGSVVTEFYTSREFPTIVDRTSLSSNFDSSTALASLLNLNVKNHITMSQGFSVHTNDMDGKMKSQKVYGEGQTNIISGVEYNYSTISDSQSINNGRLNNTIETVDSNGNISKKLVGVDYDVINDFRESTTTTTTAGIHFNIATLPITIFIIVVPTPIPSYTKHEDQIRTATTTKVIHSSGILIEKVASDSGAKVSTKNLAWDANSGEVLLTETVNEYNDKYFSFNFPAYWNYKGMSQAAKNSQFTSDIVILNDGFKFNTPEQIKPSDYLFDGDEVFITGVDSEGFKLYLKAWVVEVSDTVFKLIDSNGKLIKNISSKGKMKVIRSGYRNLQTASMASITSMRNPLYDYDANNNITSVKGNIGENPFQSSNASNRIVNASAVEYKDLWPAQCECNLPKMKFETDGSLQFGYASASENDENADSYYNPYLYNILGNWRANKSYAFLTGRNYTVDPTPRKTGFFADFFPFYVMTNNNWKISETNKTQKWTSASEVTQYNPYGQEVENMDALKRYSSALYGYKNRFPVAVASNTRYSQLASDGFEDYDDTTCEKDTHFDYKAQLKKNDVSITTSQSHTGRKSLKIAPSKKAIVKKQVISCSPGNN